MVELGDGESYLALSNKLDHVVQVGELGDAGNLHIGLEVERVDAFGITREDVSVRRCFHGQ